jgi:asparagine synthase (glutamine-hydrolysing)
LRGRGASLAHTRLAIIDLSAAGAQPMVFEEDASSLSSRPFGEKCGGHRPPLKVLVLNGEIYSYRKLREEMEAVGEIFSGHSDTEVLLRLLVREKVLYLWKFEGMLALFFWTKPAERLYLRGMPTGSRRCIMATVA